MSKTKCTTTKDDTKNGSIDDDLSSIHLVFDDDFISRPNMTRPVCGLSPPVYEKIDFIKYDKEKEINHPIMGKCIMYPSAWELERIDDMELRAEPKLNKMKEDPKCIEILKKDLWFAAF